MFKLFQSKNNRQVNSHDTVENTEDIGETAKKPDLAFNYEEISVEKELDTQIDEAIRLAPFIKSLLGDEVGFYISDRHHMRYSQHGQVKINVETGDAIKEGSITARTLKDETRAIARVGKEVYGFPYIGTGYPIRNSENTIVGTIVTVAPIELQESLMRSAVFLEQTVCTISAAIGNLVAISEEMTATAISLNDSAQNINNEIKKTDEVGVLITEVSDRTHLLGLNAAIEAARAGEQGRGFTIVANEIRKMSDDTKGSVKEIKQNLKEMKNSIAELTAAFEQITATSEHQSASTEEISASIESLMELATELKNDADRLLS